MLKKLVQRFQHHRRRLHAIRQLHALSDYQLNDIGISRGMIEDVI